MFARLESSRHPGRCLRNAHIRHRSASERKSKRIYLPVASLESPPAHVWNKGRLRWGWRTIPIKVKTITAATGLTGIADTFRSAILGRSARCTDCQDISTIWDPKKQPRVTKLEDVCRQLEPRDVHLQQSWPFSTPA